MKKVVVVEDEKLVLWGINSLFEGQSLFELSGSFSQSREAFSFIRKNPPDIILTDIKMPQMDGLTLIREVKKIHPQIKIIVLSFYGDFDFVHKAFKLGIDDYILKHELERDSLLSVLKSVSSDVESFHSGIGASQNRLDYNTLFSMKLSDPDQETKRLKQQFRGQMPDFSSGEIILSILKTKKEFDKDFRELPGYRDNDLLYTVVGKILQDSGAGRILTDGSKRILMLLDGSDECRTNRKNFYADLERELSLYLNVPFYIGKSEVLDLNRLDEALVQAGKSLDRSFYHETSRILNFRREPERSGCEILTITDPSSLLTAPDGRWQEDLESFFADAVRLKPPSEEFRSDLFRIWESAEYWIRDTFALELEGDLRTFAVFKIIDDIDDIGTIKSWFLQAVDLLRGRISESLSKSSKIGEMSHYIRENYHRDLTLTSLSDKFNLNPSYISEILKKELNCGFSKYLTRVRVEEAKKLLISGHETSEEICFKVGFNSPSHFSKVFKKLTNMTTTGYRNQFQKNFEK